MFSTQETRINIAVVGLGRMGKRHVHTLQSRVKNAQVVAVCSASPDEIAWARTSYANDGITVYDNFDIMIAHSGLQAVWISTSTDVHASMTLAAIGRGLHVLCEKPLSTDINEVRR